MFTLIVDSVICFLLYFLLSFQMKIDSLIEILTYLNQTSRFKSNLQSSYLLKVCLTFQRTSKKTHK